MRRATVSCCFSPPFINISIHALHEESDATRVGVDPNRYGFQSTLSMRRATHTRICMTDVRQFQSTLSMRRATGNDRTPIYRMRFQSTLSMRRATGRLGVPYRHRMISIHALHEESDQNRRIIRRNGIISIHALHEESDPSPCWTNSSNTYFNPRSP